MIIDGHAHVFRPASLSPRGVDELAPDERDAPVEDLLNVMEAHGVDASVLVPFDEHDDYVREVLAENESLFAAIAVADRHTHGRDNDDPAVAVLRRRERFPFHALRTQWLGDPALPIRDSPFFSVLRLLADEGLPLWSYLPPEQLPLLDDVARELPDLTVVLNHLGFCPHDMRVDDHGRPAFEDPFPGDSLSRVIGLSHHARIYVMFSGQYAFSRRPPPYRDLDDAVHRIADAYGASRMLWGSDYPWTRDVPGYGVLVDLCRQTFPGATEGEIADIQGGTALRLFPHLATR